MTFEELEANINKYLILKDKGIIKLLSAVAIANRMPSLDPTWLFIVSSSSGGKSELLEAFSYINGTLPMDDMTSKTLVSGAKGGGKETSLIFRLPKNAIMVIKDLTVLLSKNSKDSAEIFSQFRMIYDGSFHKSFGTGDDIKAKVRMGLVAGVTGVIEEFQADDAAVGQRAIKYLMEQHKEQGLRDLTKKVLGRKDDKAMRVMIGKSFAEFIDGGGFDYENPPDIPEETTGYIADLAEMTTLARSSVRRDQYDRQKRILYVPPREQPFRLGKQLMNIARGMAAINKGDLTEFDAAIIYRVALFSIPTERMLIMTAATKFSRIALDGLAREIRRPEESAIIHLEDLVALEVMVKEYSYGARKTFYMLKDNYRELFSKLAHVEMTNETLEEEDPLPGEPANMIDIKDNPDLQKQIGF